MDNKQLLGDPVFVRFINGTYMARWSGRRASSKDGARQAAERVVLKSIEKDLPFELKQYAGRTECAWLVFIEAPNDR